MVQEEIVGAENLKAVFNGSTGFGEEMLPQALSDEIIKRVWEESWCRKSFRSMPMSTETLDISKITGGITMMGKSGAQLRADESRHTTDKVTLTMKTVIGNAPIDKKTIAYAIDTMLPALEEDIEMAISEMEENMFINGDTVATAANINNLYNASTYPGGIVTRDPRLEFDGLRKKASSCAGSAVVDANASALTQTHIRSAFTQLGRYGLKKADLIILVSASVSNTVLGWDDLRTLDKYGPNATILTGELGKIFGVTVIATDLVPDTLTAAGIARDQTLAAAGNRSVVLVFNKRSPVIGDPVKPERRFRVLLDEEKRDDIIILVPIEDLAFNVRYCEAICQIINVLPGTT